MRYSVVSKLSVAAVVLAFAGGCASKGYVRNQVKTSNDQLAAQESGDIKRVETNAKELSDQVGENARVTKEHTTQIAANTTQIKDTSTQLQATKTELGTEIRTVDTKAGGAMSTAESARTGVAETGKRVDGLASQFENRNNYAVAAENSVLFGFNSAKLQPEFHTVLDNLAQKVKQDPNAVIVLEGRTDSTGDADYNIKLGQQRMDAVLRYLVIQSDVPIQRIYQVSLGKDKPVADNKTKEGREQNRSTVVRILTPNATGTVAAK
jgi:outer membrane protein OmpA-like peptidoglycan-associated protein